MEVEEKGGYRRRGGGVRVWQDWDCGLIELNPWLEWLELVQSHGHPDSRVPRKGLLSPRR